jgi:hypothetical protein
MWVRLLRFFGIETIKEMIQDTDTFALLEINQNEATITEPKTLAEITALILEKYADQPLRYFNEYKRIKVVHLKSGTIRDINLKIHV